jgi:hypothetical protein
MASVYSAPLPAGIIMHQVRDLFWRGTQAGMPRPDGTEIEPDLSACRWLYVDGRTIDDSVLVAWRAALLNTAPVTDAPWVVAEQQETQIRNQLAGLRTYLGLSAPSGAQRLAMEKSLIRVVLNLYRQLGKDSSGID